MVKRPWASTYHIQFFVKKKLIKREFCLFLDRSSKKFYFSKVYCWKLLIIFVYAKKFLWFSIFASFSFFGRLVKLKEKRTVSFMAMQFFILSTCHRRYKKNAVYAVKTGQPTNCTRNVCTERPFVLIKCVLEFINLLKDCLVAECLFLVTFAHLSRFITDEDFFPFRINWLLILRFDFIILRNLSSFIIQMQVTR